MIISSSFRFVFNSRSYAAMLKSKTVNSKLSISKRMVINTLYEAQLSTNFYFVIFNF